MHRALEIERQPFLNARQPGAFCQVEKERRIEHDRRGENAVAAQEVDLQLHGIPKPANQIDVVPTLLVVAARWIVVDADDVMKVVVEAWVEMRLKDVIEN